MNERYKKIWRPAVVGLVFLAAYFISYPLKYAGLPQIFKPLEFSVTTNILQIILCLLGIFLAYGVGLKGTLSELGLKTPFKRAMVFAFIATLPMLIGFALSSNLTASLSFSNILAFTIISPFAEEVLFRGFVFRQLYRRVKTGFWSAVLLPSLLFALGHFYQSKDVWDFVGITAITFLGSVFFSWTFMRWNDNLWVPFGLHFLMNFWWEIFTVDDTALGGWLANIVRFLSVGIAIVLTIYKDKIWKPLPTEQENVSEFEGKAHQNKTFKFSYGVLLIFILFGTSQANANSAVEINGKYLIRFSTSDLSIAHVECQIPVKGIVKMSLIRTENLENGWAKFIRNLRMNTPEGKPIRFKKTSKNEWTLENNYAGDLNISYDVDFSFASKPWITGNHTAAYYNGKALFTVGRALFVYSDELTQARVEFDVPKSMKVSVPWRREKNNTFITGGKFLVLHNLVDNTIIVGNYHEKILETGGFRLQICLLDSITESSELISDYLKRILAEFIKILGKQEKSIYQITIFEAKGDGGESYLNSFAAVMSKPPKAEGAIVWANTLAHEFFHYWNGLKISGSLEGYFDTQWFAECFTEYYANLALVRSGIIDLRQWLDKLETHASMYELFKRSSPYKSDSTLVNAGKEKWANTPALYNGGAFTAFCLDTLIRKETNNQHSLDDLMKYMNEEFGNTGKVFKVAEIPVAVKKSTGTEATNFINSYVVGTKKISAKDYFSYSALNANISEYEVYLEPECKSSELNLQILFGITGQKDKLCHKSNRQ